MKQFHGMDEGKIKEMMLINQKKRADYLKKVADSKAASMATMTNSGYVTVYTNEVPYELDILRTNLYSKSDIGWLMQAVLGAGLNNPLFVFGFACAPISPPGLSVTVAPGTIFFFDFLLPIAYGVIPPDVNPDHAIYKTFINFDTQVFATPAPVTPGNSIIYLVQVAHVTADVNVVSRPYFNSADPAMPIFISQSDTLLDSALVQIKSGVAAPSPTPPTPDPGFTGLFYVTVAYGQTSIISGNITVVPGAPFITESLTQKVGPSGAVTPSQFQNSTQIYAVDIGTPNVLVANPSPSYGTYTNGMRIFVKAANSITSSSTLNVNGNGAVPILTHGQATLANEIVANQTYEFIYNSTGPAWELMNANNVAIIARVSMSAPQTITAGTRLVQFNTPDFDDFGFFSGPPNYQFVPTRPGYYAFYALSSLSAGAGSNTGFYSQIYQDGSLANVLLKTNITTGNADGSTGYVEIHTDGTSVFQVYDTSSVTVSVGNDSTLNYFGLRYLGQ